jgi:hypothetical protein
MTNLTIDTYHGQESAKRYMSVSQFKQWIRCPAKQAAILAGAWIEAPTPALLIGQYVDNALLTPERMSEFLAVHAEDFFNRPTLAQVKAHLAAEGIDVPPKAKLGDLLADYPAARLAGNANANGKTALACIDKARGDPLFMEYLEGEKQVIMIGTLFEGTPAQSDWRIMVDVFNPAEARIVDLKTSRSLVHEDPLPTWDIFDTIAKRAGEDIQRKWQRGPWYEVQQYWRQATVYVEIAHQATGQILDFMLAAVTKETPADIDLFLMADGARMDTELDAIAARMPAILAWKAGAEDPPHCWGCDYCRSVKRAGIVEAKSVMFTQ